MRPVRYGANIASFQEGMGLARHFYGWLWRYSPDGEQGSRRNEWGDPPAREGTKVRLWERSVSRILTAEEAAELNRKDASVWMGQSGLEAGERSTRLESSGHAIAAAALELTRLFGEGIEMEIGDYIDLDSYVVPPETVRAIVERLEPRGGDESTTAGLEKAADIVGPVMAARRAHEAAVEEKYAQEDREAAVRRKAK